jgi:hypothetical protein
VLDNHQGEHHLAEEFNAQLRRNVQHAGESLLQFAAAIENFAYLANVDSTEQHMSWEAARAIADGSKRMRPKTTASFGGQKDTKRNTQSNPRAGGRGYSSLEAIQAPTIDNLGMPSPHNTPTDNR